MKIQARADRTNTAVRKLRSGITVLVVLLLLFSTSWTTAQAAGTIVVGDGTPASCTPDAFYQAIANVDAGGTITFNCGPDPVTISISEVAIQKSLTIDGGGLITFTGGDEPLFISYLAPEVVFINLTIAGTSGESFAGIHNGGTLTLRHVTVSGNYSGDRSGGGGINNSGILRIEDSAITGNVAGRNDTDGGGILNGGTLDIVNSTISGNVANTGGGIFNSGTMHILNSTVSGNLAATEFKGTGGGIFNVGTATIESSAITGNSSYCETEYDENTGEPYAICRPGGGIYNKGTLNLINSTISDNSAGNSYENLRNSDASGGGIANYGTLFLHNTTLADNTAVSGGGLANYNLATVQNSIVAGNTDWSQQPSDCSGTLTSQGYNLIQDPGGCTIQGDTTGDLLNVDPLLGPLQDNGGPTLTRTLLPGSPAIDAGNPAAPGSNGTACETTDQRGVTRPQDGNGDGVARCDIGSVEGEAGVLTVTIDIKPGDSTNPINLKSKGVISVAILSTSTFDANTVDQASVTFGPNNTRPLKSTLTDVNGDGKLDLLLHFSTQQTGIKKTDTQACLKGRTSTGTSIQGCDSIRIVP